MTWLILSAVSLGILLGKFLLLPAQIGLLSKVGPLALSALLFSIGFELARDRSVWRKLRDLGWRVFLVPAAGILGSLLGALAGGLLISLSPWEALSIGAGFGWYSLSGVLLSNLGFAALGAIAFLSNVMRELLAVVLIPWLAERVHPVVAIAPGGATTMDTTLPIIARSGTHESTMIALLNGATLSALVPFLVPLFAGMIN